MGRSGGIGNNGTQTIVYHGFLQITSTTTCYLRLLHYHIHRKKTPKLFLSGTGVSGNNSCGQTRPVLVFLSMDFLLIKTICSDASDNNLAPLLQIWEDKVAPAKEGLHPLRLVSIIVSGPRLQGTKERAFCSAFFWSAVHQLALGVEYFLLQRVFRPRYYSHAAGSSTH